MSSRWRGRHGGGDGGGEHQSSSSSHSTGTGPSPRAHSRRHDAGLNEISLEYSFDELRRATNNFSPAAKIGQGAYGNVFKGTLADGNEVAVKYLHTNAQAAGFEEEVKVLSMFRHQNLVILMGFARNGPQRLLVYELLAGGDVGTRLQKGPPLPWRQRVNIALDAACGLSHLHNQKPKVYHRDIKSANILLDRNGTAKWGDFGLACLSGSRSQKVAHTAGTIGYADPSYISTATVTEHTEVYSFGWVLMELLTSKPPAVQHRAGHISYLSSKLRDPRTGRPSVRTAVQFADPAVNFPPPIKTALAKIAIRCIAPDEDSRPDFRRLVSELRGLVVEADAVAAAPPHSVELYPLSPVFPLPHPPDLVAPPDLFANRSGAAGSNDPAAAPSHAQKQLVSSGGPSLHNGCGRGPPNAAPAAAGGSAAFPAPSPCENLARGGSAAALARIPSTGPPPNGPGPVPVGPGTPPPAPCPALNNGSRPVGAAGSLVFVAADRFRKRMGQTPPPPPPPPPAPHAPQGPYHRSNSGAEAVLRARNSDASSGVTSASSSISSSSSPPSTTMGVQKAPAPLPPPPVPPQHTEVNAAVAQHGLRRSGPGPAEAGLMPVVGAFPSSAPPLPGQSSLSRSVSAAPETSARGGIGIRRYHTTEVAPPAVHAMMHAYQDRQACPSAAPAHAVLRPQVHFAPPGAAAVAAAAIGSDGLLHAGTPASVRSGVDFQSSAAAARPRPPSPPVLPSKPRPEPQLLPDPRRVDHVMKLSPIMPPPRVQSARPLPPPPPTPARTVPGPPALGPGPARNVPKPLPAVPRLDHSVPPVVRRDSPRPAPRNGYTPRGDRRGPGAAVERPVKSARPARHHAAERPAVEQPLSPPGEDSDQISVSTPVFGDACATTRSLRSVEPQRAGSPLEASLEASLEAPLEVSLERPERNGRSIGASTAAEEATAGGAAQRRPAKRAAAVPGVRRGGRLVDFLDTASSEDLQHKTRLFQALASKHHPRRGPDSASVETAHASFAHGSLEGTRSEVGRLDGDGGGVRRARKDRARKAGSRGGAKRDGPSLDDRSTGAGRARFEEPCLSERSHRVEREAGAAEPRLPRAARSTTEEAGRSRDADEATAAAAERRRRREAKAHERAAAAAAAEEAAASAADDAVEAHATSRRRREETRRARRKRDAEPREPASGKMTDRGEVGGRISHPSGAESAGADVAASAAEALPPHAVLARERFLRSAGGGSDPLKDRIQMLRARLAAAGADDAAGAGGGLAGAAAACFHPANQQCIAGTVAVVTGTSGALGGAAFGSSVDLFERSFERSEGVCELSCRGADDGGGVGLISSASSKLSTQPSPPPAVHRGKASGAGLAVNPLMGTMADISALPPPASSLDLGLGSVPSSLLSSCRFPVGGVVGGTGGPANRGTVLF